MLEADAIAILGLKVWLCGRSEYRKSEREKRTRNKDFGSFSGK